MRKWTVLNSSVELKMEKEMLKYRSTITCKVVKRNWVFLRENAASLELIYAEKKEENILRLRTQRGQDREGKMRVPADSRAAGLQRKQLTEEQVVQKSKRRRNEEAQGQDIPHLEEDWPFFFLSAVKRG